MIRHLIDRFYQYKKMTNDFRVFKNELGLDFIIHSDPFISCLFDPVALNKGPGMGEGGLWGCSGCLNIPSDSRNFLFLCVLLPFFKGSCFAFPKNRGFPMVFNPSVFAMQIPKKH